MPTVTLQDVAARAGVSVSTASAALNDLAIVRVQTRERVSRAAEELGYVKDASAAVLVARRRAAGRAAATRLTLAYLQGPQASHARSDAFASRARHLGYAAEWVNLRSFRSPEAASRTLWQRRVAGIFHATPGAVPEDGGWDAAFDWSRFSVVKSTRARPELRFHRIRHDAYEYAALAVRQVHERGYRRIAVVLGPSTVPGDDEARLAAVLAWSALHRSRDARLAWTLHDLADADGRRLDAWLRRQRADVVVGFPESVYWGMVARGWRIPGDIAFAAVVVGAGEPVAGCQTHHEATVGTAADLLDQQIKAGVRGMVPFPQEHVIAPTWKDAVSLPDRTAGEAAQPRAPATRSAGRRLRRPT